MQWFGVYSRWPTARSNFTVCKAWRPCSRVLDLERSSFKGIVILVEPVGMNCPACNAFSGGIQKGGYKGTHPQNGLPSIEQLFPKYTGGCRCAITAVDSQTAVAHPN
jgi:hypothetical protein